jgi:hypothetical protein
MVRGGGSISALGAQPPGRSRRVKQRAASPALIVNASSLVGEPAGQAASRLATAMNWRAQPSPAPPLIKHMVKPHDWPLP